MRDDQGRLSLVCCALVPKLIPANKLLCKPPHSLPTSTFNNEIRIQHKHPPLRLLLLIYSPRNKLLSNTHRVKLGINWTNTKLTNLHTKHYAKNCIFIQSRFRPYPNQQLETHSIWIDYGQSRRIGRYTLQRDLEQHHIEDSHKKVSIQWARQFIELFFLPQQLRTNTIEIACTLKKKKDQSFWL